MKGPLLCVIMEWHDIQFLKHDAFYLKKVKSAVSQSQREFIFFLEQGWGSNLKIPAQVFVTM